MEDPRLRSKVRSRPAQPAITTKIHSSRRDLPESWGRWRDTARKNMRNAVSSSAAESGNNQRHCHAYTDENQRMVTPEVHNAQHVQPSDRAKGRSWRSLGME